jgi:hypothetical protein
LHEELLGWGSGDRVCEHGVGPGKLGKEELSHTAKARPCAVSTVYGHVELNVANVAPIEEGRRASTHKTSGKPNIEPSASIAGVERGFGLGVKDGGAFLVQLG